MKLLLVEDNEMNRDMLSRRLARRGYDLVFAGDGQLAVELAARESPALILMVGRPRDGSRPIPPPVRSP